MLLRAHNITYCHTIDTVYVTHKLSVHKIRKLLAW